MAVGVVYAGWISGDSNITLMSALILSLGIAIQNFPEGAIISMPLRGEGMSRPKSFLMGVLSGAVEPVAGVLTILAAGIIVPVLPYLLSFAAGAMLYVVVGGTDSGNVRRQPFQHRNCLVCSGFFGYDDSRCCARVTGIRKNGVTN